jgi:hypothetical protein
VKDIIALASLVLAFATWVTVHIALSARLALSARPRWRGLVALVVLPSAPMYGFRAGFRRLSTAWLLAILVYLVALLLARA